MTTPDKKNGDLRFVEKGQRSTTKDRAMSGKLKSAATKLSDINLKEPSRIQDIRIAGGRFKLVKPLGSGSFSDVYAGIDLEQDQCVAVKLERLKAKAPQLIHEAEIYKRLQGSQAGIPKIFWTGAEGDYNVLVMEMLGPCLEDLLQECHGTFSVNTVLLVGEQMLSRLEYCHSKMFVHRDLKPENFAVGYGDKSFCVYIIDFGLAKKYKDSQGNHMAYEDGRELTGTARYASINTHLGIQPSRRDDLEGLAHVLLYFLLGRLPWQGLPADNAKERYQKICEKKRAIPVEQLCRGQPKEMAEFLVYVRGLQFTEVPDYAKLRSLLKTGVTRHDYDWPQLPAEPSFRTEQRRIEAARNAEQARCGCFSLLLPRKKAPPAGAR
jgi:casein kinase 1